MADRPIGHWLIYGDSGAGKSTGASTFPKPLLVLAFDPRGKEMPYVRRGIPAESIADDGETAVTEVLSRKTGEMLVRIEHYLDAEPTKPTGFARFRRRLVNLTRDIDEWGIQTLVLDSVTFMELAARKEAQYVLNPNSREPRQWFGSSTDALEEVLMIRFGALPINVVVLAHIDEDKDEVHGLMVRHPSAPGRLRKRSPAGYSELYRAYVKRTTDGEREYNWQTQSDAMYNCASQIDAPDPCLQDYRLLWTADDATA
jgi:hypothetical protein